MPDISCQSEEESRDELTNQNAIKEVKLLAKIVRLNGKIFVLCFWLLIFYSLITTLFVVYGIPYIVVKIGTSSFFLEQVNFHKNVLYLLHLVPILLILLIAFCLPLLSKYLKNKSKSSQD